MDCSLDVLTLLKVNIFGFFIFLIIDWNNYAIEHFSVPEPGDEERRERRVRAEGEVRAGRE